MVKGNDAFVRVLSNLSKAVLKKYCIFNILPSYSEDLGYTYIEKNIRGKEPIAQIFINPAHLMFANLSEIERYMFAFGVAVHEMLHQKFTNFEYSERMIKKLPEKQVPLFQMIDNIFEDSRIEFFGNQVFGGWALKCLKYAIQKTWEMSSDIKDSDPLGEVIGALIQYGDTGKIKGSFSTQEAAEAFCYVVENYFEPAIHNPIGSESIDLALEATKYLCLQFPNSRAVNPPSRHQTRGRGENAKAQSQGSSDNRQKQNNRNKTLQKVKNGCNNCDQKNSQGAQENSSQGQQQKGQGTQSSSAAEKGQQQNSEAGSSSAQNTDAGAANETGENGNTSCSANNSSSKNSRNSPTKGIDNSGRGVEGTDDTPSEIIDVSENTGMQQSVSSSENGDSESEDSTQANSGETSADNTGNEDLGQTGSENGFSQDGSEEDDGKEDEELDAEFEAAAAKLAEQLNKAAEQIASEVKKQERETETLGITNDPEADRAYITRVQTTDAEVDAYQLFDNRYGLVEQGEELAAELATIFRSKNEGWERSTRGRLSLERYLDPNFNSPFVFDKKLAKANDVAIAMLVDNSGSMSGCNRISEVRKMASVCAEAFNALNVPFAIYGHDGNGSSIQFSIYKEFDDEQWYNIVRMEDGDYNYDGGSIRIASDYLKRRDEANKVLIVMSDGLSHNVPNAELAIREASQFATVCGVALATRECEAIKQMYGENFITCEYMDELNEKLTEKLKELSVNW